MSIKELSPKKAADLFLKEPEKVLLTFPDFMELFSITPEEMLKELQSGRLVAVGAEGQFFITAQHALEWMENILPKLDEETGH